MDQARIAIIGASGYTGAELARLIVTHPRMRIAALAADRNAGRELAEIYPHLAHLDLPTVVKTDEIDWSQIDLAFCGLPHATAQEVIGRLPKDLKVVDLSADFRLRDPAVYEAWYGHAHHALDLQAEAVYGLPEFYRDEIRTTRICAGTGCFVVNGLLPLIPLLEAGLIDPDEIVIDSKTGITGAGRSAAEWKLFSEVTAGTKAYGLGGTHRHTSEFDQELSKAAGREVKVCFTPHLLPMNRGILGTIYVKGEAEQLQKALEARYADEPFVQVLPMGSAPLTQHVTGSNLCRIAVSPDRRPGRAVIVSVIDNLMKGASGQAVQCANLMLGFDETEGLELSPMFP